MARFVTEATWNTPAYPLERVGVQRASDGSYFLNWTDFRAGWYANYSQHFSASGVAFGNAFAINPATANLYGGEGVALNQSAATNNGGQIVVSYLPYSQVGNPVQGDSSSSSIQARLIDSAGNVTLLGAGGNSYVNTTTQGKQSHPQVTTLTDGSFIISWQSDSQIAGDAERFAIFAQRFNSSGTAIGSEIKVYAAASGDAQEQHVASLTGGGYVLAWYADGHIMSRIYDADGTAHGPSVVVDSTQIDAFDTNYNKSMSLIGTATGGYAMAVGYLGNDPFGGNIGSQDSYYGIALQYFDQNGNRLGSPVLGNAGNSFSAQVYPSLHSIAGDLIALDYVSANSVGNSVTVFDSTGSLVASSSASFAGNGADNYSDSSSSQFISVGRVTNATDASPIGVTIQALRGAYITNNRGADAATMYLAENLDQVVQIVARDVDHGTVAYSIAGGLDAGAFSIDTTTGQLRLLNPADFDNPLDWGGNNNYQVTVRATAGGISDDQTLNIIITDVNDGATRQLSAGNDRFTGSAGSDWTIYGFAGSDTLTGNFGGDTIYGGDGADKIYGLGGRDHLYGEQGADQLDGGTGADWLYGGAGNDSYFIDDAGDQVFENANEGTDVVNASVSFGLGANVERLALTGSDNINGSGNDLVNTITGNSGNNVLAGLGGNDILSGGAGDDRIAGGTGTDSLTGGSGSDTFVFDTLSSPSARDTIRDFVSGIDRIELNKSVFAAFLSSAPGQIDPSEFFAGAAAQNANQHLIYNPANGLLYYDADGKGGAPQVQIALLSGSPNLSATDIIIA